MKKVICLLSVMLTFSAAAMAQDSLGKVWISAGQMPEFPGGQAEMMKYISTHVDYPDEAANQGITGRVMVRFVVNTDGSLSGIGVARAVHPLLDSASIKMVREMPRWTPGQQDDQKVRVQVVIPINFSLKTVPPDKDSIYSFVQKMPSFPGGNLALENYLDSALTYPFEALQNLKEGNVYVTFIIDKTGKIRSAEIEEGFDQLCNEEAKRLVLAMPEWSPGMLKGFPVEVRKTLLVRFQMNGEYLLDGTRIKEGGYKAISADSILTTFPEFPGGEAAMMKFIQNKMNYPSRAVEKNIEGKVLVEFIVDEHGEIQDARVINFCYHEFADAALKVVNEMPTWTPGMANGLPVKVRFVLPIKFSLN